MFIVLLLQCDAGAYSNTKEVIWDGETEIYSSFSNNGTMLSTWLRTSDKPMTTSLCKMSSKPNKYFHIVYTMLTLKLTENCFRSM